MSSPPRQILSGGTMEYGQNVIMQRLRSAHNLHEMENKQRRRHHHHVSTHSQTKNGGTLRTTSNSASQQQLQQQQQHEVSDGSPRPLGPAQLYSERDPLVQVEEGRQPEQENKEGLSAEQAQKVYNFFCKRGTPPSQESLENNDGHNNTARSGGGYGFYNSFLSLPSSPKTTVQQFSQSIRFQVLVWNVGALDVLQNRVPVTFRVTIFWNDPTVAEDLVNGGSGGLAPTMDSNDSLSTNISHRLWEMRGRQKAVPVQEKDAAASGMGIDVPPVSILNVVTFDTIGSPEVALLRQETGLFQWTCMYRATLIQDHWKVENFPHDEHDICLRLAVLAHRKTEGRWDRRFWHLGLATEKDSMGCVRVPHGLVVGELSIPEFKHNNDLKFSFDALDIGPGGTHFHERCLSVTLRVSRNSYYYDRNIVPLLALLNFVAITITALGADKFFERGLLTLNITFVEISIRMATDKHLPSVPYQIKLQRVLNEYFFGLLFLVLESNLVFELHRYGCGELAGPIDTFAASAVFIHNAWTMYDYYILSRRRARCSNNHK